MPMSAKTIRTQLSLFKPLIDKCSLETTRRGQNMLGELMKAPYQQQVLLKPHHFTAFEGSWIIPKDQRREGVLLYLHGGGYVCGGLDYALGFGSTLAVRCGIRVFCAAYRLAPEHPFPAALEDALEAYRYLLKKGYSPSQIVLCGESAGGGLIYSLCLKLRKQTLALPAGLIGISPWTDLTASGPSYVENRQKDPSITQQLLAFYRDCYCQNPANPFVSPLFGDLRGFPPSLLFAGGDEIMRSDTEALHARLLKCHCKSHLQVTPERWHAYVLYDLAENQEDFETINRFLTARIGPESKLRWMPLDNAAKIYPAARNRNWSNVYRVSASLREEVDRQVLQSALDVTVRRFPSIATRLRRGVFWYYLQQLSHAPKVQEENSCPLARMTRKEARQCAFRVIVYKNRIACEFFHSLTDGSGAVIFLKTLVAEYLLQKHGIAVPAEQGVLGRLEEPAPEELEDSFPKYAGPVSASRKEHTAWHLQGTPEPDGFLNITCFRISASALLERSRAQGVSLTAFLCAVMMQALLELQAQKVPQRRKRRHIRVQIPINLRRVFPSRTIRNFSLYTIPEVDPKLGDYDFSELCKLVHHRMGLDLTSKQLSSKIATNVGSERSLFVKLMPLFIKNIVMKAVYMLVGDRKICLSISNLGAVQAPQELLDQLERMDFILNAQTSTPHNCGIVTVGDTLYANFTRCIQEPELELAFFQVLRDMGIQATVESNQHQ